MTKIEKAIWAVSDLRDFYLRISKQTTKQDKLARKRKKEQQPMAADQR